MGWEKCNEERKVLVLFARGAAEENMESFAQPTIKSSPKNIFIQVRTFDNG